MQEVLNIFTNTPKDDKRLLELDAFSAMVEEYEKELAALLGISAGHIQTRVAKIKKKI